MKISREVIGELDGQQIKRFVLQNDNQVTAKIINYGGTVTSITMPDREGNISDVVCGFDTLEGYFDEEYRGNSPYFGCLIGRYAARIKDGKFAVEGKDFQLATNDGSNHLHGGVKGFDKRVWNVIGTTETRNAVSCLLSLQSHDGEEAFPGNLDVTVEYSLNQENELSIHYRAETDRATPVSLTNHTYFNLNGFQDTVLDHVLQLRSDRFLVPDETNVPVGKEQPVAGTVADFNDPRRIGDAFEEMPFGFEHYYAFLKPAEAFEKVAEVTEPTSGRRLEVLSTEPGALFYTGRYTSDKLRRESGAQFGQFRAFCIETSKYPNGPNIDEAPRCILRPGETYDETTVYKLSWG